MTTEVRYADFVREVFVERQVISYNALTPKLERDAERKIIPFKPPPIKLRPIDVHRLIRPYVEARFIDQFKTVVPLAAYLALFQVIILRQLVEDSWIITAGLFAVIVGLMLFMEGLKLGLMPFGEIIGNTLPKKSPLPVVLFIAFLLGIGVTLAEPAIGALKAAGAIVSVESAPYLYALLNQWADALVLVVGAGDMSQLTVRSLVLRGAKEIAVTNRSLDRAVALAEPFGGHAIPWETFVGTLPSHDIVISSVQTDQYIVRRELIEGIMSQRNHRPLFLIDLGLPRNIDPQVQDVYNVFLYNLDDLQTIAEMNRRAREKDIPKAEHIIEQEAEKFMRWQESLPTIPTIKSLRRHVERIRETELEAHLRKLGPLSERERNIITALSHAIVNKIMHNPTVRLKQSTDEQYLESIRYLFDLEEDE